MTETSRFPWHLVVAAATAIAVGAGVRALLAQLRLFTIVEWGVAVLVGFVAGLVAANVVLARSRRRARDASTQPSAR
ncbi:hypothetical protein GCM10009846_31410 [Agrococcus versicolor]|uniref:Uncharacterized protein n=1 Tax=Agrococcus versicolor TaxID=501482 RepID=A0ABP5MPX2_9MICO